MRHRRHPDSNSDTATDLLHRSGATKPRVDRGREGNFACRFRTRYYYPGSATRLVAYVVTGKIDVRRVAAQLPEGAAPETAADDADAIIEPELADEEAVV
jgi:hypothetical protein